MLSDSSTFPGQGGVDDGAVSIDALQRGLYAVPRDAGAVQCLSVLGPVYQWRWVAASNALHV